MPKSKAERISELTQTMKQPHGPLRLGKRYIQLLMEQNGGSTMRISFKVPDLPKLIAKLEFPDD